MRLADLAHLSVQLDQSDPWRPLLLVDLARLADLLSRSRRSDPSLPVDRPDPSSLSRPSSRSRLASRSRPSSLAAQAAPTALEKSWGCCWYSNRPARCNSNR